MKLRRKYAEISLAKTQTKNVKQFSTIKITANNSKRDIQSRDTQAQVIRSKQQSTYFAKTPLHTYIHVANADKKTEH